MSNSLRNVATLRRVVCRGFLVLAMCFANDATGDDHQVAPSAPSVSEPVDIAALRRAIGDLTSSFGQRYPRGQEFGARLDEVERQFKDDGQNEKFAATLLTLQQETLLANPMLDFDQLLLVRRKSSSPSLGLPMNLQCNGSLPRTGFDDELTDLSDGPLVPMSKLSAGRFIGDVDLHFSGERLLFSSIGTNNRRQVHELSIADGDVRQVTPGNEDDIDNYDACDLPGGDIIFSSTPCFKGLPCVKGSDHVANLYVMNNAGEQVRQLTFDQDHDWCPTVMKNGRALYQRWEYSDIPHFASRILCQMNPDGTEQAEFYGSNSYWPNSMFYARLNTLATQTGEALLLTVILQLIVIIAAARAGGWLFGRLGQPQVVGEIATGLLLGPSCFGRWMPELSAAVFPLHTDTVFMVFGQLGLMFLMFIVGLEFEFRHLKTLGRTAAGVALAGIALPFALGAVLALSVHSELAADYSRPGFVLFIATALSITAIPILGRIIMEFKLSQTPLGVLTISAAAVDDALGWILLASVSAAVNGSFEWLPVLGMLLLLGLFVAAVFFLIRPLLISWSQRVLKKHDGGLPLIPFSLMILAVLLAAAATNAIGVFSIFGPFVLGAAICDQREFQAAIRNRMEDFVTAFFLPVFFTYTGLRTNIGTLDSTYLWIVCGMVTLVATAGKMVGCGLAARLGGMSWRDSASVAVMMNTRALMGLIAINIGRDIGVIPDSVFCMMVLMAIFTTLLTAPILRRLLPSE